MVGQPAKYQILLSRAASPHSKAVPQASHPVHWLREQLQRNYKMVQSLLRGSIKPGLAQFQISACPSIPHDHPFLREPRTGQMHSLLPVGQERWWCMLKPRLPLWPKAGLMAGRGHGQESSRSSRCGSVSNEPD